MIEDCAILITVTSSSHLNPNCGRSITLELAYVTKISYSWPWVLESVDYW